MTQSIYLSLKTDRAVNAFKELVHLWEDSPAGEILTNRLMDFIETTLGTDFENDQMKIQAFTQYELFKSGISELPEREDHH